MSGADCYLLLGKRLDFTLGYGIPAVYGDATFVQVDVDADALRRNRTPDALDDAVERAVATEGPAMIDVRVDPDAVSPDAANGWLASLTTNPSTRGTRWKRGTDRADDRPEDRFTRRSAYCRSC